MRSVLALSTPLIKHGRALAPGVLVSIVVAMAATFLAEHYATPIMLLALLLGMSMSFLTDDDNRCKLGIEFCARTVLRMGVALLGIRLTLTQMMSLGLMPLLVVLVSVTTLILISIWAARRLGFDPLFGLLTGGAVAICGASAALALSAALPAHVNKEKATLFTVIGVSALSTLAMIFYPMVAHFLGFNMSEAGIFLGATIHDVAQVVGAGYSFGRETGDTATVVKLMRVAMLVPIIILASLITRAKMHNIDPSHKINRPPLLPWFVVAFILLAAINSSGIISPMLQNTGNTIALGCLVVAIAALGLKTKLKELITVGVKPIALMLGETLLLASGIITYLLLAR